MLGETSEVFVSRVKATLNGVTTVYVGNYYEQTGAAIKKYYYADVTTPTRRRYTGQINDSEIGLYFYNARYYSSALGRFISADTIVPDGQNPRAWNRYAYVVNNPLKYNDPTGHCFFLCALVGAAIGGLVGAGS